MTSLINQDRREHWQTVYQNKGETQTSWFRPHLDESLRLIDALALDLATPIIDVGGGRSTLVDDLLARDFHDLTVLDLSQAALDESRARLGEPGASMNWLAGDITTLSLPEARIGLWHDRAVFHFLTDEADQRRYVEQAAHAIRAGGYAIIATFALDGPEKCSGLPVCRYDAASLAAQFADSFDHVDSSRELHSTPFETSQAFTYMVLRRHTPESA
jgi:SAM-dependent methyltransferase